MNDGETAVAGEVGLGAGASAAEAMEMTAKRTAIVARSMVLVEAIEEGFEILILFFARVLLGFDLNGNEEVKGERGVYIGGKRGSYGQVG